MECTFVFELKLKLRSHNTSYCLIEVVTKTDLTVLKNPINYIIPVIRSE